MIPISKIEQAIDWLIDNVDEIGKAKERLVKAGYMLKHIKALEMKRYNEQSAAAQEREAYASQRFLEALTEEAVAAGEYEKIKARREVEIVKIDVWRTQEASYRGMAKVG